MLPGPRQKGSLPCGRYLLAPLTGNSDGSIPEQHTSVRTETKEAVLRRTNFTPRLEAFRWRWLHFVLSPSLALSPVIASFHDYIHHANANEGAVLCCDLCPLMCVFLSFDLCPWVVGEEAGLDLCPPLISHLCVEVQI